MNSFSHKRRTHWPGRLAGLVISSDSSHGAESYGRTLLHAGGRALLDSVMAASKDGSADFVNALFGRAAIEDSDGATRTAGLEKWARWRKANPG